jgi:hypothetical protein
MEFISIIAIISLLLSGHGMQLLYLLLILVLVAGFLENI